MPKLKLTPLYHCYKEFFSELPKNPAIFTPNYRLSRFVHDQYISYMEGQGSMAWPTLPCFALGAWFETTFLVSGATEHLLSDVQSKALWQMIVKAHDTEEQYGDALVDAAISGSRRFREWLLKASDLDGESRESTLFLTLQQSYIQSLNELGALDAIGAQEHVIDQISAGVISLPESIILIGFDEVSPLVDKFIDACRSSGSEVLFRELLLDGDVRATGLPSSDEEITAASQWAKRCLESNPSARIGVVIPSLAAQRSKVVRVFTETFQPGYIYPVSPTHAPGFNISAGQPLAQTSVIAFALNILQLNQYRTLSTTVVDILQSPFIAIEHQHFDELVVFCQTLLHKYTQLTQAQLRALLGASKVDSLNDVAALLQKFHSLARGIKSNRRYLDWAMLFTEQLDAVGWPGNRTLDTLEFQQVSQWSNVLKEFSLLDSVLPPINFVGALEQLSKMLYVPFLPQTATSPIQILGVLEAAGMHFDYLWVMGLSDNVWPEPCQPNPLLPTSLQKERSMPRASVEKEFILAKKITQRFVGSAREVIFSYPLWDGDQGLRASPLISKFEKVDLNELVIANSVRSAENVDLTGALEELDDTYGLSLNLKSKTVVGGSAILKEQAACAFRAYAKYRLGAQNQEEKTKGLSPIVRGNLIHNALERVWNQLESLDGLGRCNEIGVLVSDSLERAWLDADTNDIGNEAKSIELSRAHALILQWLDIEKSRLPFRVESQERTIEGHVGPLTLKLRLDRMDRLADGTKAVVDYKTGKTDIKSWFSARPDEPQVPLYSLLSANVTSAVFAELSTHEVAAKGVTKDQALWAGLKSPEELRVTDEPLPDWNALREYWRSVLSQLAIEFDQGFAAVNPKYSLVSCRFCDLQSLCRFGMSASIESDDNNAGEKNYDE